MTAGDIADRLLGEPDERFAGRAARVRTVSRLDSGVCLICIDGFEPLRIVQPYLEGAFALARGATGILLDLRADVGGYPEAVAYLAGRLLGDKAVKLSEVVADGCLFRTSASWTVKTELVGMILTLAAVEPRPSSTAVSPARPSDLTSTKDSPFSGAENPSR